MDIQLGTHNISSAMLQKYLHDNNINVSDQESDSVNISATEMSVYYYQCYEMALTQLAKLDN